jgi:glycosyltransferase involved in cell wall biosynthesis/tetratricopeptide (TPR) repeat protein
MAKRDKNVGKKQSKVTATSRKSATSANIKFDKKLSLVIPCYNETNRVQHLVNALKSFDSNWYNGYEVIVVDDGSSDGTADKVEEMLPSVLAKAERVEVIRLEKNQGKGAALQAGIAQATGDFILTLDADMAAKPMLLKRWLQLLPNNEFRDDQILIGSREHKDSEVNAKSDRKMLGRVFNLLTQLTTSLNLKDTQCGFKLYPAAIAKSLFADLSSKGWSHDVEILYKAKLNNIEIESMPVKWQHVDGEKINVGSDGMKMAFQTIFISLKEKFNWFFISPFKGKTLNGESGIYRFLFAALMVILLFLMPMLSSDFGISGDEYAQKVYGEFIVEHFETDGSFKAEKADYTDYEGQDALTMKPNLWLYGGGFDYMAAKVSDWFPAYDEYNVRHFLNALVGFLLIFFTGLLGKELTNSWRMGFLAALLAALSPRIFGHSMMNPKDIPFATAYMLAMVNIIRIVKQLPNPGVKPMFYTALGIAFAISIRIGGLLLVGLLGLFVIIAFLWRSDLRKQLLNIPMVGGLASKLFAVIILGYLGGLLFWPYALESLIANPLNALSEMTNFSTAIQMLFEGEHYWSDNLPWYYIPKWQMMAAPLAVLVGIGLAIILYFKARNKQVDLLLFLTAFAGVFPIVYALMQDSAVYDGMRQFIFVYPIFVVLAAFGWSSLASVFNNKIVEIGSMVVLAIFLYLPASWMIENHPYEYVYINEAFGGVKNAATQYETDYWMTSAKGLAEWFAENVPEAKTDEDVLVALSDNTMALKHHLKPLMDAKKIRATWVKYDRREDRDDWDYLISFHRFKNEGLIKSGAWPLGEVIYEEKIDGVTIGSISKRTDKFGKAGKDAEKANNFPLAIENYKKAIEANPKNEQAHIGLINAYSRTQDYPEMKKSVDAAMKLTESHVTILSNLGLYYLQTGDNANAIATFEKVIDLNFKSTPAYYYLALAYNNNQESLKAIGTLEKFADNSGNIPQAYQLAIQLTANSKYQQLYFQAKQAYFQGNFQGAYQAVSQSVQAGNNYEYAVRFKEALEKASGAAQQ